LSYERAVDLLGVVAYPQSEGKSDGEVVMRDLGKLAGIAAAVVSIGAGIYLLTSESASDQTTVFDALMHGIGAYFIARGLWMITRMARSFDPPSPTGIVAADPPPAASPLPSPSTSPSE
jgi:hypothetical protein